MPTVDSLDIQISAQATNAAKSLEKLVDMFDKLRQSVSSLSGASGSNLSGISSGIQSLGNSMQSINNLKTADFTRLAKNITKLGSLDMNSITNSSIAINKLVTSLSVLSRVKVSEGALQIAELAKGITQLGYKSATKAIDNIPLLANAMKDLMSTLSGVPKVSQNLIDMTNALAKLARTGGASGTAASSLTRSLNTYTTSTGKASKGSFSLASAIGKLYATYWLLFRAFGTLGKAIDMSSDLTEVQNVVDVTFGEYSSLIEKMSQTSITDFGMSELTVKQVASRFQAMGTAMGFTQGKMADMSVELTKLTADMASFYNVEQANVAEDLESIFTGQTRPLRQYGLDLTEATLKEWAMKQGIDANMKSMTQAEKTMLRYQYVLANTGAAQGDFAKTAGTWANQVRILKQNFEALGSIVGGTLINAFKPLVTALNYVMGKLTAFARVVSDSLGKIFGWQFQSSGSGGVLNDFEDLASSADDLSGGTGSASDNLGSAADNAKKLKNYLLGIDELNVISQEDTSGSGGSGGSGSGSGGASGSATDTGGQWTKTESIWENYESDLDTLYKLGDYIGTALTDAMNSINWDKVYAGARNFGSGLAEFLNGLISPELFGTTGKTIANALNAAIYASLALGETFDFEEFGISIGTGLSEFFVNFDFVALSSTLNIWVDGLEKTIGKALQTFEWDKALENIKAGLETLEFDTVAVIIGAFTLKKTKPLKLLKDAILAKLTTPIKIPSLKVLLGTLTLAAGTPAFDVIGSYVLDGIGGAINNLLPEWAVEVLSAIGGGMALGALAGSWFPGAGIIAGAIIGAIVGAFDGIKIDGSCIWEHIENAFFNFDTTNSFIDIAGNFFKDIKRAFEEKDWISIGADILLGIVNGILGAISFLLEPIVDLCDYIFNGICDLLGIHSPAEEMKPIGENIVLGIIEGFTGAFGEWFESISKFVKDTKKKIQEKWGDFKLKVGSTVDNFKKKVSEKWDEVVQYWKNKDILEEVRTTYESFKDKVSELWDKVIQYWGVKKKLEQVKTTYEDFKAKVKEKWDKAVQFWNSKDKLAQVKTTYESFKDKIAELWDKAVLWWKNNAKLPKLNIDFDFSTTSIANALNKVINFINTHIIDNLNKISIKIPTLNLGPLGVHGGQTIGFNLSHIKAFENGGFPQRADLFWANENGVPELVGTMGSRTAVASGAEITGIANAVYSTGETEASLLSEAVVLLREIAAKEMSVNLGDKAVARANNRGQRAMGMRLITEF